MKNGLNVPLNQMLSYNFWELHEAAFMLTTWPKNICLSGIPLPSSDQINRTFLYVPEGRLNKKILPISTQKLLYKLKEAVEKGELFAISRNLLLNRFYGRNVSYILRSQELILWALLKGFFLPLEMQKAIEIPQIKSSSNKNLINKIKNQTVGQYLFKHNLHLNISNSCNHEWMQLFGTAKISKDSEKKAIRRAINELFNSKGKAGRPAEISLKKDNLKCLIKVLPDVIQKDENGSIKYNIQLLQAVIITASKINIHLLGLNNLSEMTENDFINYLLKDDIINLYLQNASNSIKKIINKFILDILSNYYCHPKIQCIPNNIRKGLKIGKLCNLNQEFCLEPFTPEERELFKQQLK